MVTVGVVHTWRDFCRLPLVVRNLDDGSPAVRFTSEADSCLREIRVHSTGRPGMGGFNILALALGEESSKVRLGDDTLTTVKLGFSSTKRNSEV